VKGVGGGVRVSSDRTHQGGIPTEILTAGLIAEKEMPSIA